MCVGVFEQDAFFSQLLSVGCSGEIAAAAAEVKAASAMMNGWLLFNWLTTLSRHTPAAQLYQEDLIQDETDQDCDVFRWNIFMAANTKFKTGLYFLQKGGEYVEADQLNSPQAANQADHLLKQ